MDFMVLTVRSSNIEDIDPYTVIVYSILGFRSRSTMEIDSDSTVCIRLVKLL